MLRAMRSASSGLNEKEEGRILQPYRQPCADAKVRAPIPGDVSIFRARTHAHGAGSRRSLHEHYSARLSFARRSVDLAFSGRIAALRPDAAARLRQANGNACD